MRKLPTLSDLALHEMLQLNKSSWLHQTQLTFFWPNLSHLCVLHLRPLELLLEVGLVGGGHDLGRHLDVVGPARSLDGALDRLASLSEELKAVLEFEVGVICQHSQMKASQAVCGGKPLPIKCSTMLKMNS